MRDIFDNKIFCGKCNRPMRQGLISKNGFNLRSVKCEKCNDLIFHPQDKMEYENFMRLKEKDFNVKMRMVGNSYAVSIPREIVDFLKDQERMINDMVRLNFEGDEGLRLRFNIPESDCKPRTISSREVRIVRDGKVYHEKQLSDSLNPKNNRRVVLRDDISKRGEEE